MSSNFSPNSVDPSSSSLSFKPAADESSVASSGDVTASTHDGSAHEGHPQRLAPRRRRKALALTAVVLGVLAVVAIVGVTVGLSSGSGHWGGCGSSYEQPPALRGSNATTIPADDVVVVETDINSSSGDSPLIVTTGPVTVDDIEDTTTARERTIEVIPGKTEWPEWVGRNALEARPVIMGENPNVTLVLFYTVGMPLLQDYRTNRVRIAVYNHTEQANMTIAQVPKVG